MKQIHYHGNNCGGVCHFIFILFYLWTTPRCAQRIIPWQVLKGIWITEIQPSLAMCKARAQIVVLLFLGSLISFTFMNSHVRTYINIVNVSKDSGYLFPVAIIGGNFFKFSTLRMIHRRKKTSVLWKTHHCIHKKVRTPESHKSNS